MNQSFPHGIHLPDHKEATAHRPLQRFGFAPYLVVLLSQHLGKPAQAIVKAGEEVRRGQVIATAQGELSVPLHAPATGKVTKVGLSLDQDGQLKPSIVIQPYAGDHQIPLAGPAVSPLQQTPTQIIQALQASGLVGLGGAAFPTHFKLKSSLEKGAQTLLINACECEPFLTSDHRIMAEAPAKVIEGILILRHALGATRCIIGLEDNKAELVPGLRTAMGQHPIELQLVKTKYPQGAEKLLIKALLGLEVPSGKLPADVGVMVANVTSCYETALLLPQGQGLLERAVTLAGSACPKPGNYWVPIGTPLDFLLTSLGVDLDQVEVIFGGPMMGKAVACLQTPTTKGVTGILIEPKPTQPPRPSLPCIRCGECLKACPLQLNPSELGRLAQAEHYPEMKERFHLTDCFECGCCTYTCPSRIPLVQLFRTAKSSLRAQEAK